MRLCFALYSSRMRSKMGLTFVKSPMSSYSRMASLASPDKQATASLCECVCVCVCVQAQRRKGWCEHMVRHGVCSSSLTCKLQLCWKQQTLTVGLSTSMITWTKQLTCAEWCPSVQSEDICQLVVLEALLVPAIFYGCFNIPDVVW